MSSAVLASAIISVVVLAAIAFFIVRRGAMSRRGRAALELAVAQGEHIPPSLHPVIDANLCIGSFSCIKACPEGDIIGVIDGVAQLVEAAHCIGHGRCATECPVGAIRLVFGSNERGIDLPETDDTFESSRKGVFIVGELGGMGLIKNALRQGLEVAGVLQKRLKKSVANADVVDDVDVVVVGGGPAGIATAVGLKEKGLVARVLEQDTLGGCIAHYPRGKIVMSDAVLLPFYGKFGRSLLSKEDLLTELTAVLAKAGVTIDEGQKVVSIEGEDGRFVVGTERGLKLKARAVVLATGLRGSPRKLGVPGEERSKVLYRLIDPEQFHGKRVLVVGGGDSAVEAAIQLAEESTAKVSISYRQDSFSRAKARNRDRIAELIAEERIRPLLSTDVKSIDDKSVNLSTKEGAAGVLKNDVVIVSAGGELPAAFLKGVGVSIRKYTGQEKGSSAVNDGLPTVGSTGSPQKHLSKAELETRTRRRLSIALFAFGSAIMTGLFLVGGEYYLEPFEERRQMLEHEMLKPAGLWGHSVGVIATVFMLATFIYPLRKRVGLFKGGSTIRSWLTFHMFVGVMSPLIVAFHAAFLLNNMLAVWTWVSLAIVVGTGVFGRFLFGFVPAQAGRLVELGEIRNHMKELERRLEPRLAQATNAEIIHGLFRRANEPPKTTSFWATLLEMPAQARKLRQEIGLARPHFGDDDNAFASFRDGLLDLARGRTQEAFYAGLKRMFRVWLVLHVVLASFMVVLITAHIGWALYLGFGLGGGA
jgi:thioredoxin reductase/Pyruvate/2-oxoacid:ferredoxin oxidoreductase delta subunit